MTAYAMIIGVKIMSESYLSILRQILTDPDHTPSKWFQTPKSGPVGVIKLYSESQGKVAESMSVVYTMFLFHASRYESLGIYC